jgi:hypothetical protein
MKIIQFTENSDMKLPGIICIVIEFYAILALASPTIALRIF